MNAMRKTAGLTEARTSAIHSSTGGIHLLRRDTAQDIQAAAAHRKPAAAGKPASCVTALAAERITAAVLLVMCIAAAVFI
ncbi:MAG TPA: hypothetical protein VGG59_04895 [Acidobacteriaceae bacterium]|jgi:hypothetical protein